MLPARARLTRRDDFTRTVRGGRRAGRDALVVHWLPAEPIEGDGIAEGRPARVGFVVSKAVGPAVTRNLVVRRLRHLVRERVGTLPTRSRMVVRALPAAASTPYDRLGADLDAALDRVLRRGGSR